MVGTYYTNTRTDILALLPQGRATRSLEIGGGDFSTLCELKARIGGEAWGVDIRPSETKLDRMLVGSVTGEEVASALAGFEFDVIMANDVIEHVDDTPAFLSVIKKHLAPEGNVLLSVPNIRNLKAFYHIFLRGSFPREEAGLFDRTHVRWFCRSDVERLANDAGLKILDHEYGGRFIKGPLKTMRIGEMLALHNLFRLGHR